MKTSNEVRSSPTGSRLDCALVGVQERTNFCERAQGKNLRGSLEGGVVQEYDPVGIRVGAPCSGEEPATMTGIYVSDLQHQR